MGQKIYFVNYFYPPKQAIGARRNYFVSKYLGSLYDEVEVISSSVDEEDQNILYPTYRAFNFDYQRIRSAFKSNKKSNGGAAKTNSNPFLARLLKSFPLVLLVGEGGLLYILLAWIHILKTAKNGDVVYSSYSPYSDHVVAFLVKLVRPHIIWIADFRDLHIDNGEISVLLPSFHKWLNKLVFSNANLLTTVSEGLRDHLVAYNESTYVLYNGYESLLRSESKLQSQKFKFVYTGNLYSGKRDASRLFKVVSELINEGKLDPNLISLEYAGNQGYLWSQWAKETGLLDQIIDHGFVSHSASRQLQLEASINVLITWATPLTRGILTGKFYEYLSVERPIVLLIQGSEDPEFENLFEVLNCGGVYYDDESHNESLKDFIFARYSEFIKTGRALSKYNYSELEQFKWDNLATGLKQEIDSVERFKN